MKFELKLPRSISDEELKNEVKRVAELIPETVISQKKFNELSKISADTLRRKFGSWENALKFYGLEHRQSKYAKFYTEIDCFENLLTVWTYYGKQPTRREMDISPSKISHKAYERRFGKWSAALQAFVDYMNSDKLNEKEKQQQVEIQILETKKVITSEERRDISLGLRYKVLSRDRFKCVKCGVSPSTDINCKLHIDHIVPFSKGGLTTLENLQTLCENCNLGKGNRYNE